MNRFKEGVRLLAFIGGLVIALGAMVGVASADQTIQGTVTAELLNLTSESGTSTIDGNLTVNKDLKVNYPIYAWGNLVKFKGDSKTTLDFNRSDSKIYVDNNLVLHTDDNLVVDAETLRVEKDLRVARNAGFFGDLHLFSKNGTSVKPDFRAEGYALFDGTFDVDGESDFSNNVTFSGGTADINNTIDFTDATVVGLTTSTASSSSAGFTIGTDLTVNSGARVGTGSTADAFTALADDSLFVEGALEVDGAARFDGAIDANSTLSVAGASTFTGAAGFDGGANPANAGDEALGTTALEWDGLYVGDDGVGVTFGAGQSAALTYDSTNTNLEVTGDLLSVGAGADGDTATAAGDLLVQDALEVDGATDLDGTLAVADAATLSSTLAVTGASTFTGAAGFDGGANPANAGDEALGTTALEWDGLYVGDDGVGLTLGADQDAKITWDATAAAIEVESGLLSVGADPGGATATGAGDLIVSDALEVDGSTDLDGALTVAGAATFDGTATFNAAPTFNSAVSFASQITTQAGINNTGGEILMTSGNMQFNDGIALTFGTDDDLEITWDNTAAAYELDGALVSIGDDPGGTTATGDNDLIVVGNLEVDTNTDLDGNLTADGTAHSLDATDASNFTIASDGAADDLTISVTGATDSSLFLTSAGTGADAVRVNASAGGIDVDSASTVTLDTTNDEFQIDTGTQDVVLAGSAEGTAALTMTAGDLVVTDGDLTLSGGELLVTSVTDNTFTLGASSALVVDASTTDSINTDGAIDIGFDSETDGAEAINLAVTSVDDDAADTIVGQLIGVTIQDDTTATDTVYGIDLPVTQLDTTGAGTGIRVQKAAGTAGGAAAMTAGIEIDNADTDADAGGADTAADLTDGILFNTSGAGVIVDAIDASDAGITNALNVAANAIVGTTGAITYTGATTWSSSGGDVTVQANNDASNLVLAGGDTNPDAGEDGNDVAVEAEDDFLVQATDDADFDVADFIVDTSGGISLDTGGTASNFTLASDGAADDLTISVTGATDSSLFLTSAGTGADAVRVNASAGGIDIDAASTVTLDTTNDELQIGTGTQDVVLSGSADGTAALTVTAGDVTLSDGDLTVSGGDVNVGLDDADTMNVDGDGSPTADLLAIGSGDTFTAASSGDALDVTMGIGAQDGSDAFKALDINLTGADHTGASNTIRGIELALTTPDAESAETGILFADNNFDADIGATTELNLGIGASVEAVLDATNLQPGVAEGNSLGAADAEWEALFLGDDAGITFGLNDDATLLYDETTDDRVELAGTGATLYVEDNVVVGTNLVRSVSAGNDPLATGQGSGAITTDIYEVSASTAGDDVTLPSAAAGLHVTIINSTGNSIDVFPASSDAIDDGAANASEALAANTQMQCTAFDATTWSCVEIAE